MNKINNSLSKLIISFYKYEMYMKLTKLTTLEFLILESSYFSRSMVDSTGRSFLISMIFNEKFTWFVMTYYDGLQ